MAGFLDRRLLTHVNRAEGGRLWSRFSPAMAPQQTGGEPLTPPGRCRLGGGSRP